MRRADIHRQRRSPSHRTPGHPIVPNGHFFLPSDKAPCLQPSLEAAPRGRWISSDSSMASRASQQVVLTFIGNADHPSTDQQGIPPCPMDPFSFHRTRHPAFYRPQKHLSVADGFHLPNEKQSVRQSEQTELPLGGECQFAGGGLKGRKRTSCAGRVPGDRLFPNPHACRAAPLPRK